MKAIIRNILLATFISTFAMLGALGGGSHKIHHKLSSQQIAAKEAEETKATLTLYGVAFGVWALCLWRCSVIQRRIDQEREFKQRFNEYMRNNAFQRQYH